MARVAYAIALASSALVGVAVFTIGVADGSVSSSNIVPWLGLLGLGGLSLGGGIALHANDRRGLAILALAITAVPGLLAALLILLLVIAPPRWN